ANSWTRNQNISTNFQSPERFNQFGYNIGGPGYIPKLVTSKSKAFFFFSQERLRRRTSATNTRTGPSPAMRRRRFSELLSAPNNFFSSARIVRDPLTGQPFLNNVIPTGRLSPNGLGLLRVYPDPTPGFQQGTSNWIGAAGVPTNQRKETMTLDLVP